MTRSIRVSRRAAMLLAGMATATSLLASGCGAGQIAETSLKEPSIQGVNVQTAGNEYKIRGLVVDHPGPDGYPAGATAPLTAVIYNDTREPVTLTITTDSARDVVLAGAAVAESGAPGGARLPSAPGSVSPTPSEATSPTATPSAGESPPGAASPTPSATTSTPVGAPARIEIPAFGYAQLNKEAGNYLLLVGLNESLLTGESINLTFDFGNGQRLTAAAPVAVPLSPGPLAPEVIQGEDREDEGHGG